jgi:hypothetical protein
LIRRVSTSARPGRAAVVIRDATQSLEGETTKLLTVPGLTLECVGTDSVMGRLPQDVPPPEAPASPQSSRGRRADGNGKHSSSQIPDTRSRVHPLVSPTATSRRPSTIASPAK